MLPFLSFRVLERRCMQRREKRLRARHKHLVFWLTRALVGIGFASLLAPAVYARSHISNSFPGTLVFEDGKVTARLNAVSLHRVLKELGRLSGSKIRWLGSERDASVSVDFADLSLPEALRRFLGEKNFMLFYSAAGEELRLARIWVSSHPTSGQPLLSARSIQTTQALSTDFAPPDLMQTALSGPDDNARIQAIWRLRRYAAKDPRVKSILQQIIQSAATPHRVRTTASRLLSRLR